jgi:hypothetical protein
VTLVQQDRHAGATTVAVAPALPSRLLHPWQHRWARRREQRRRARRQAQAWELQDVLVGRELFQYGHANLGYRTVNVPRVVAFEDGPPPAFIVRPLAGQVVSDFTDHAAAIAECLDVARVRITRQADGLIRVELLAVDPLDTVVAEGPALLTSAAGPVLLGVDDVDSRYRISPVQLGHTVIQGQTRSGKSAFCYWLLSQMASAPDLIVAGSDPTGLLLRPFAGTVHEPWQVLGMGDPDAHIKLLRDLVTEMDNRIATIPSRRDQIIPDDTCPLIMVILEEYAGLLRAVEDSGSGRKSARAGEVQRLVARLLSEGHKAAIRLVIILQRADAAVLGGFERGQCSVRISFRVDTADAVVMLHPSGRAEAEQHATCPPGLALLSAPGVQLARIRAPYLGDGSDGLYGVYADLVATRTAPSPR